MGPLARLPVFFALAGKRAVVAGGDGAAAWKVELLSAAGASVAVYASDPSREMCEVAADPPGGSVSLYRREWRAADFDDAAIAVGAFADEVQARGFSQAARTARVPVNLIDRPALCDFSFGAIVNRSPLVIGISTDGAAPILAQAIRAKLEALIPRTLVAWISAARQWRSRLKATGLSFAGRRRFWQLFTAHALTYPDSDPGPGDFDSLAAEVKGLGAAVDTGSVTLVGAGPGDPELLTLRAVRALQSADVILFDDLVSRGVLDFARREARTMLVGKTGHGPSCRQEDINALMCDLARQGKRVVRLKGGDSLIFSRAGEEIAACRAANIPLDIVPGITAAQGAAAALGFPLTGRGNAGRVQFVTGHGQDGALPKNLEWGSLADPSATTAIYMPVGTLQALVVRALSEGLDPATPAVAVANATRPGQAVTRACIGELPGRLAQQRRDGPVLVLIGRVCVSRVDRSAAHPQRRPSPTRDGAGREGQRAALASA
ncbi:MAG: siroheme synthase CysG [Pseudorhodoplanes sp.]